MMNLRARLVLPLLAAAGITLPARAVLPAAPAAKRPIRVAVYVDGGVSRGGRPVLETLAEFPDLKVETVDAAAIRSGRLADFDVVLYPGGSGGGQGKSLGEEGRQQVRAFVERGGGYLGICAGAYLATCDYPWSLRILDAKVIDRAHWARGTGDVNVSLTPRGRSLLGLAAERQTILYFQGPLLAPAGDPDVPDYQTLAVFETEIAKNGAPPGVMLGKTAVAAAPFGKGRVLCFSPHPERTKDTHAALRRAIGWVARR